MKVSMIFEKWMNENPKWRELDPVRPDGYHRSN